MKNRLNGESVAMNNQIMMTLALVAGIASAVTYPVVDTAQMNCYDNSQAIEFPTPGKKFYGQDAQYSANPPSYKVNGDGTVSDLVTGLMWTQNPGEKKTFKQAVADAAKCHTGKYDDWRLPTIKELYSLIQLNGTDPDPTSRDESGLIPFIDRSVFKFTYGKEADGDRIIDSQFASSTKYVSTTMGGNETMFGVNFADGRIKGYPITDRRRGSQKTYYVLYVRGNPDYGVNHFKDNHDGTVTDEATGLTWMKADSGKGMDWPSALDYAEKLELAGHSDWRLPNAKELQTIIDYTRSPDTTKSAAIDPIFNATPIKNEAGQTDFAQYWTSSSHVGSRGADSATYFAFGRALGYMNGQWMDVHGAGAQRSDPKVGDASKFPQGRGPQGDAIRIQNQVRCVRGGEVTVVTTGPKIESPKNPMSGTIGRRAERRVHTGGFIAHNDKNNDGKVSRTEFSGPAERFDLLDKNGDGFISADEAPTGPPSNRK